MKLTIQLTSEQQKQIKDATGKNIVSFTFTMEEGELSQTELANVSGGTDPLRLLAEVSVLEAQDSQSKLSDVA